jgi:L-seryl-tRNA(Ser) seleniumtransferase
MTLRQLPSVDGLLGQAPDLIREFGRPLTLVVLRATLDSARERIRAGEPAPDPGSLLLAARAELEARTASTLRPVINATGVILHTNLGRSLLSAAAAAALVETAGHYTTLEYDLPRGERGSRSLHAESLLVQISGAEAALVVNNAAGALLLALTALARGREVIVSRGQLIEIGGGFRLPDVMKQSGARLVEVGATNRTYPEDVRAALTPRTAALLRAHASNFKIIGFTSEPGLAELGAIAAERGLPLIDDLGSGALLDTAAWGLAHEPMVQESIQAGAGLVIFSGDKLLGGPQAGLIAGRRALVDRLKKHPLARALRADKLTLAPLAATLLHYLKDEAPARIPVWQMISLPLADIEARARRWAAAWGGEVLAGQSTIGGGSLPGETLPTRLAAVRVRSPNRFLAQLREPGPGRLPIIARVEAGWVVLDPRTVTAAQSAEVETAVLARLRLAARPAGELERLDAT